MKASGNPYIIGRQVELIYRNQKVGQIVSTAVASYMAWIAYDAGIWAAGIIAWGLAAIGIALLRLGLARRYLSLDSDQKAAEIHTWHKRVRLGALVSGLIWATGTLLVTLNGDITLQFFAAFIMAGMTAGALPVLGADRLSYRLYAWPIILCVIFGVFDTDHMHVAFSIMSFFALVIFTRSADVMNQMLDETFELELEKSQLLERVVESRRIAEQSDRAKTQFLANISHELRTPMNGVIGLAELLSHGPLSHEQKSLLDPLRESATDLMSQIENLIQLSALEAGHIKVNSTTFAMSDLGASLMATYFKTCNAKGLDLLERFDENLPAVVTGDIALLQKIFAQLAGNAIKFTDRGNITLSAHIQSQTERTVEIEFAISDTGPGIPAEKISDLDGIFVQVDSSSIRRHGGSGIGLRTARKLIELLGGNLKIESDVGVGSRFSFTLPFGLPDLSAD